MTFQGSVGPDLIQRNFLVVLTLAFTICAMLQHRGEFPSLFARTPRFPSALTRGTRQFLTFEVATEVLNGRMFRKSFRMGRNSFKKLLSIVYNDLRKCRDMGERSGRKTVDPKFRLAVCLRMMSGAKFMDVLMDFSIGYITVYSVFRGAHEMLEASGIANFNF